MPVVSSFLGVLAWIGENDTKTLVWIKIFCFVFAEMKTDTFENALVWMMPKRAFDFSIYQNWPASLKMECVILKGRCSKTLKNKIAPKMVRVISSNSKD